MKYLSRLLLAGSALVLVGTVSLGVAQALIDHPPRAASAPGT